MVTSSDLRMPDATRKVVMQHFDQLRAGFKKRGWGAVSGFGARPALIVIDLAKMWTDPGNPVGADLDSTVAAARRVLDAARAAKVPIFFTTMGSDPNDPEVPVHRKKPGARADLRLGAPGAELDPRLGRLPTEKLIVKKYTSSFKGTDLQQMLTVLGVDTLIITGCTTSGCIYAACRDAVASFRVVVPREAVGDRCELFQLAFLLDIEMKIGDVLPTDEVVKHLNGIAASTASAPSVHTLVA